MAKKRKYNTRLIKATEAYDVQQMADLFGLHKNAVLHWLKEGLRADTSRRPYLVRGDELIRFLNERQRARKRKCSFDQFFCFKCRAPRRAEGQMVDLTIESPTRVRLRALCADCGTPMNKSQGIRMLPAIESQFHIILREGMHLIESFNPSVNHHRSVNQ